MIVLYLGKKHNHVIGSVVLQTFTNMGSLLSNSGIVL